MKVEFGIWDSVDLSFKMECDNSEEICKVFCIFCGPSVLSLETCQEDVISSTNKKKIESTALRKLLQKSSNSTVSLEDGNRTDDNDLITGEVYLCDDCNGITLKALESRSQVEQLEVDVGQLQKQLLELLKKLQVEMEIWSQGMCKIEEKVYKRSSSDDDLLVSSSNKCQDKTLGKVRCRILESKLIKKGSVQLNQSLSNYNSDLFCSDD